MNRIAIILLCISLLFACAKQIKKKDGNPRSPDHQKAIDYRNNNKIDSSLKYFNLAKEEYLLKKDSLNIAKCLVNIAIFATNKGDYFGGQELSLNAIAYFHPIDSSYRQVIHSNYNNLGIANYNLKNYEIAIKFYDKAIQLATKTKDKLIYLNNKAKTLEELKRYDEAISIYNDVISRVEKNSIAYARALANIASTKWLQNPSYNALHELLTALKINEEYNELPGQNLCYARLADFFSEKDIKTALYYTNKMYYVAQRIQSANDQLEALHKLIILDNPAKTKQYFRRYKEVNDSLQNVRAKAKNQFALIRFDTLNLQKDIAHKDYQIKTRELLLLAASLLFIAGAIIVFLLYKKRTEKIKVSAQNDIHESQLRTSKKVHDVVANGLYRVIAEMENKPDFDKEQIIDKIDQLYNKSRDISYEVPVNPKQSFHQKVNELLASFRKEKRSVDVIGNNSVLWVDIDLQTKEEFEHIIQELMINMDKHSEATKVSIRFAQRGNQILLHYQDNGVGMPEYKRFGNGLTNAENRINSIGGSITFENKVEGGLDIKLSFPIS